MSEEQKVIENLDPQEEEVKAATQDDLKSFARFATEEALRRSIKKDTQPFGKEQIFKILYPQIKKVREETLITRKKEVQAK